MGNRGVWNLRVDEKWYRSCRRTYRVTYPDDPLTPKRIRYLQESRTPLRGEGWAEVPFPTAIHPNFSYVYTLDLDAEHLIITQLDYDSEIRAPKHSLIPLDAIHSPSDLSADAILLNSSDPFQQQCHKEEEPLKANDHGSAYGNLPLSVGMPSPLNELQYRMFTDFIFQWRYYIDDPLIWEYPSRLFYTFVIGILRLAAWDFEVTFDVPDELPISAPSIPLWKAPEADIFWFHGFLIVQCLEFNTNLSIVAAISRALEFCGQQEKVDRITRVILTSLHHVVVVEVSPESKLCSDVIPLLTNTSARQCSPGFRILTHIFTSPTWKQDIAKRETWGFPTLPPELLNMVLTAADPNGVLAFAQSSRSGELYYYSTIPQFGNVQVLDFGASIPCCGDRNRIGPGVFCHRCFVWKHIRCLGLLETVGKIPDLCDDCQSNRTCWQLNIGAIGSANRRQHRERGCIMNCASSQKALQLRLSKPTHLRPEFRLMGNSGNIPPRLIDYTIRFAGGFSGLSYGLDDYIEPSSKDV